MHIIMQRYEDNEETYVAGIAPDMDAAIAHITGERKAERDKEPGLLDYAPHTKWTNAHGTSFWLEEWKEPDAAHPIGQMIDLVHLKD